MSDETDGPLETLAGIVAVATLPAAALAEIFVGGSAAGEIDDAEFERRLERLLEAEGVEVRGDVTSTGWRRSHRETA